jgi:polyprenyl-phospho-N-acetylgalactosaminyl synthase
MSAPGLEDISPGQTWVVIAAYNEARVLGSVVTGVVEAGYSVVVVDDGSQDDTSRAAREAGAVALRHALNRGQGAALQTGIDFALRQGAARIVTFDADGQHHPSDIPPLLAALQHADVALGSRGLGSVKGARSSRRALLRLATLVSNRLSGLSLTDAHCGLRAFRADAAKRLRMRQDRMAHASELLSLIRRSRLRLVEVPVHVSYTEYSMAKGQSGLGAVRILFDHFFGA